MMTRTEIDEALAHLIKLGSHPPSPPGDSWMVAILARVVADQERRLRELEAPAEHPAVALLREIEWSGEDNVCPSCGEYGPHPTLGGGPTPGTHRSGCKLAALINGGARDD